MNLYHITFFGRLVGSIGITYHDVAEVRAEGRDQAVAKLYETHEHVSIKHISEWDNYGAKVGATL